MRMPTKSLAAIAVGIGLATAVAAPADAGPGHHDRSGDHQHGTPRLLPAAAYLPEAARANRFEIVTGQLAQERAQSTAIKELGGMFVADHSALLAQGSQVAQQLGIAVPEGLDPRRQAIVDKLSRLSGARFDAAWLRAQLAAHEQALGLNLFAAVRGENDAIRTLGQGALPVVTKHLGELIDLAQGAGTPNHHHRGSHRM